MSEFEEYWARGREVAKDRVGLYDLAVILVPADVATQSEGFAACLVGRSGRFAGGFILRRTPTGDVILTGRWCAPSGIWYVFRPGVDQHDPIPDMLNFAKRVAAQEDAFDPVRFSAARMD